MIFIIFLLSLILISCNSETVNEGDIENNITSEEQKDLTISNWLNENAYEITSLTSEDYSDLEFLKPILEDKRVVLLGESSHGVSEYNQVKTRLIKYLHEELDYDVIAFESGLAEASAAYINASNLTSEELMSKSIFKVWNSTETLELFNYIKDEYKTNDPLILTGFDIQPSSPYYGVFLKEWFSNVNNEMANLAYDVESKVWSDLSNYETFIEDKEYLVSSYGKIIKFVNENEEELRKVYPAEEDIINITKRVLEMRINSINDFYAGKFDYNKGLFDTSGKIRQYSLY